MADAQTLHAISWSGDEFDMTVCGKRLYYGDSRALPHVTPGGWQLCGDCLHKLRGQPATVLLDWTDFIRLMTYVGRETNDVPDPA